MTEPEPAATSSSTSSALPTRSDLAVVIVASLAFATSGPLGKIAGSIPAAAVASVRTGLAAIVLALVAPGVLVRSLLALSRRQRLGVLLAGTLLGAHFALFLGGLATTSLAAAVALVSLEPLAVVLAAFVAFRLRPTRRELAGLFVATAGAAIVASSAGVGEHRLAGDLLVLGAVALFGAYVAAARGLRDAMPATPYAAAVYGTASLVLLPAALPMILAAPAPTTKATLAVVGLALVPTLIGHTLVQRAARHAPPVLVALVCPGETIGGIALGAVAIGALPTVREAIGAVVVVAGATLAITGRRSAAANPS
jgi:drug/metabolite transporter (DMT)-like permease